MILRNILKFLVPVRVYDNYVDSYWPALKFTNKIRYMIKSYIPIGSDSPFGRLCYIKGHYIDNDEQVFEYSRLSDMGKQSKRNGREFVWTHWNHVSGAGK